MPTQEEIAEFKEYLDMYGQTLGNQVQEFGSEDTYQAVLKECFAQADALSDNDKAQLQEIWQEKILIPHIETPKEIIATEKTYLNSLRIFMEATKDDKYKKYKELQVQRNEVAKMIQLSQEFLLLAQTSDNPPQDRNPSVEEIAKFFNDHAEDFKVYTEYAIHYSNYEKLTDIKKEPGKSIYENLKEAKLSDEIGFFTIQSIQRIPKYQLLFEKSLNNNAAADAPSINEALKTIKKIKKDLDKIPDSEKKINILKKQQKFIKKYIEEIEKIKINNIEEKKYWKNEVKILKNLHKALNNDTSIEAQKFIIADSDHKSIEFIQADIQSRLDTFLDKNNPLAPKKDSELNVETLKDKVLRFFALEEASPIPAPIFTRSNVDNSKNIGPGIAVLFSKIAGTPKHKILPENALKNVIQKDINQIQNLYQKEILSMIKKEKDQEKKQFLKEIYPFMSSEFNSETFLQYYKTENSYIIEKNLDINANPSENKIYLLENGDYKLYNPVDPNMPHTGSILQLANTPGILSEDQKTELQSMLSSLPNTLADPGQAEKLNNLVTKLISKQPYIKPKDEKNFSENISQFIFSTIINKPSFPDINDNEEILDILFKKVSTKFLEMHAPATHKKSIKELNQYIKKLEVNLHTLNSQLGAKAPDLVHIGKENNLKEKLKQAQELHNYLINPDPNTLSDNLEKTREISNALAAPDNKKDALINIVETTLKMSDPHYNHIKKLDKYIAELDKDLEKNPQDPNVPVGPKESDRLIKKEIAEKIKELLLHPTKRDPQTGVITQNLTINSIEGAITRNTSVTHTLLGLSKGRLDPILRDILTSIKPESVSKKRKP